MATGQNCFAAVLMLAACCGVQANDGPLQVTSPDWRDQVIYFVLTDRFADGNPVKYVSVLFLFQKPVLMFWRGKRNEAKSMLTMASVDRTSLSPSSILEENSTIDGAVLGADSLLSTITGRSGGSGSSWVSVVSGLAVGSLGSLGSGATYNFVQ